MHNPFVGGVASGKDSEKDGRYGSNERKRYGKEEPPSYGLKGNKIDPTQGQAGGGPPSHTVFCDTKECQQYIHAVEDKSKALTDLMTIEVDRIKKGLAKQTKEEQIAFLEDVTTWHTAKRKPWLETYPEKVKDCGSTLPGPCKEAIDYAAQHDGAVEEWAKRYKKYTGRDPGIRDEKPKEKEDKPWNLNPFSWGSGGGGLLAFGLIAAGVAYAATRK